ncbi:MAG: P-loop NTPase [Spirochaetes bacterium]|nr:P-loop NTPase [Spirochaetota bacterium]
MNIDFIKNFKRIKIISGHYGCGKSELAVNWAFSLINNGCKVAIVDLDVVNPYFTSRGISDKLEERGIRVFGPSKKLTLADVPALPPEIFSVFDMDDTEVIFDLGGDAAGGKVLSFFYNYLSNVPYDFFYLVNANRPFTMDFDGLYEFYSKIESATRLKFNYLINSTHLLYETSIEDIKKGNQLALEFSEKTNIPFAFNVVPDFLLEKEGEENVKRNIKGEIFKLNIKLRPTWLDEQKL